MKETKEVTPDNKQSVEDSAKLSRQRSSRLLPTLVILLAVFVGLNIIVMTVFSATVNKKLNSIIELSSPQVGELTVILPRDCPFCGDLSALTKTIKEQNVELTDEKIVYIDSDEAGGIVDKYSLERLPALIFVSEQAIKPSLIQSLDASANISGDNSLIWEQTLAPYFALDSGSTVGLVSVTYLVDERCADCYDVSRVQRGSLAQFGVAIVAEQEVDISTPEGQELIAEYGIEAVPTAVLSKEASAYSALLNVWKQVGTVESDGSFVFRNMEAIGDTYKNLATGEIVGGEST